MTHHEQNGGRVWMDRWNWAIIVTMASLLIAISGAILNSFNTHVTTLEATVQQHGERIAVIESEVRTTNNRLQRIEDKLDKILDQLHPAAKSPTAPVDHSSR